MVMFNSLLLLLSLRNSPRSIAFSICLSCLMMSLRLTASKTLKRREAENSMKRRGLQGIAFWHNGMKQMSANKPLMVPSDAKGLKFRVQASDVLVAQFEQLGANPQNVLQRSLRRSTNEGYRWSREHLVKHLR